MFCIVGLKGEIDGEEFRDGFRFVPDGWLCATGRGVVFVRITKGMAD